jgi:hypothetical protein
MELDKSGERQAIKVRTGVRTRRASTAHMFPSDPHGETESQ